MIDINLVKDRSQVAPGPLERLVPLLIIVLLVVYGGTIWMSSYLHELWSDEAGTLRDDIARARKFRENVAMQPGQYSEEMLELIEFVGDVAALAEQKQYWAAKLASLRPCLPDSLVVQAVKGQTGREIKILGHAVSRDREELEQMRDFVHKLAQSKEFRRGLSDVRLHQVFTQEARLGRPQRYEFSIDCVFETKTEQMDFIW